MSWKSAPFGEYSLDSGNLMEEDVIPRLAASHCATS